MLPRASGRRDRARISRTAEPGREPPRPQLAVTIEPDSGGRGGISLSGSRFVTAPHPWRDTPELLRPAPEALGDEPLRSVSSSVRVRNPFRPPDYQFPAYRAVRVFERKSGTRFRASIQGMGLAVEGDWMQPDHPSASILASWQSLDRVEDWLPSAPASLVGPTHRRRRPDAAVEH